MLEGERVTTATISLRRANPVTSSFLEINTTAWVSYSSIYLEIHYHEDNQYTEAVETVIPTERFVLHWDQNRRLFPSPFDITSARTSITAIACES